MAAHTALRRLPPYAPGYGPPLAAFLENWVSEAQPPGGLHIRLEPDRPGGSPLRTLHQSMLAGDLGDEYARLTQYLLDPPATGGRIEVYLELTRGTPFVGLFGGTDARGKPWDRDALRAAVLAGDRGWLTSQTDVWRNPFIIGRLRSLVWSGNGRLWRHCGADNSQAARLAWETLHGTVPWEWRFRLQKHEEKWLYRREEIDENPHSVLSEGRRRTMRKVAASAGRLFPRYRALPTDVPLKIFEDRRRVGAGLLEAIAFYLVEFRDGPGIPPSRAAKLLGCKDHTSLRHAIDGYTTKNPRAPKWPGPYHDWGTRIKVGDDGTMAHH